MNVTPAEKHGILVALAAVFTYLGSNLLSAPSDLTLGLTAVVAGLTAYLNMPSP